MDAHNRFERRSLRDVLIAQGILTEEVADELMTSARENNEPFGSVVVEAGHVTAWDLAKTVATHYNMPCLPLAGFVYDKDLARDVAAAVLYQYQVLPVGRFGKVRSFVVVEPPTRDCIAALSKSNGKTAWTSLQDRAGPPSGPPLMGCPHLVPPYRWLLVLYA